MLAHNSRNNNSKDSDSSPEQTPPRDERKLSNGSGLSAPSSEPVIQNQQQPGRSVLPDLLPQSRTPPQERARFGLFKDPHSQSGPSLDSQSVDDVSFFLNIFLVAKLAKT